MEIEYYNMGFYRGPNTNKDNLVLFLDAKNPKSYPGTGNTWYDLSGNNNDFTIDGSGFVWNSDGYFTMTTGGIEKVGMPTQSADCSCIFWIKTTEVQSLFWGTYDDSTGNYLGAYRVTLKEYYGNCGTPDFRMDLVSQTNIYDNLIDDVWHMVEFRNVDFSGWTSTYTFDFSKYTNFNFGNGLVGALMIYDTSLTDEESSIVFQNFRGRYGL